MGVDKVATIDQSKKVLETLLRAKRELVDDLHCKIKARDIFETCKRVSPLNAFDAKKPKDKQRPQTSESSQNLRHVEERRPHTSSGSPNLCGDMPLPKMLERSDWANS